jgi:hypothetical protein
MALFENLSRIAWLHSSAACGDARRKAPLIGRKFTRISI